MHEQPAGWYRDPVRPNLHRYWSGERWSDWLGEERWAGDGPAEDRNESSAVRLGERAS